MTITSEELSSAPPDPGEERAARQDESAPEVGDLPENGRCVNHKTVPAGSALEETLPLRRQFYEVYDFDETAESRLAEDGRPFLSVITRTTGRRTWTLRETLMTLAGQSLQDFEVILAVHCKAEEIVDEATETVRSLLAEFPASMTRRLRVIQCTRPGRASPLNDALPHARGQYISVLDDDDFVFSRWVETFKTLADRHPGAMLRAACVRQDYEMTPAAQGKIPRATSWFSPEWPSSYDAVGHLHMNATPFMSVAVPADAVRRLRLRWDETLSTTEDWLFIVNVAMNCGVAASPEITSVYRWWTNAESSSFLHSANEWSVNRKRILDTLNKQPVLLPPGSVARICSLIETEKECCLLRDKLARKSRRPARRLVERLKRSARKRVNRLRAFCWPD
jgi:glycosyltransferase involved in cell wall biosynthesis